MLPVETKADHLSDLATPQFRDLAQDFNLTSNAGINVILGGVRDVSDMSVAFVPAALTVACDATMRVQPRSRLFTNSTVQVIPIRVDAILSLKEFHSN